MMLSNFLFRVAQYARENRARIVKALVIAAAVIVAVLLIVAGVERWKQWRYEKRVQALEQQFRDADAKAKDAQQRADAKQREIDAKQSELQFWEARAQAADNALRNAKQKVVTLKETYETIRYTPMPGDPVSCADACSKLAAIGYPCK
jgi:hypothetical protein